MVTAQGYYHIRLNPDDMKIVDELSKKHRIMKSSDIVKLAIREMVGKETSVIERVDTPSGGNMTLSGVPGCYIITKQFGGLKYLKDAKEMFSAYLASEWEQAKKSGWLTEAGKKKYTEIYRGE